MRYHATSSGQVPFTDAENAAADAADAAYAQEGFKKTLIENVIAETQRRLDAFAKTRGYDDMLHACAYDTSTIPRLATEGKRAAYLRDNTWETLYGLLGEAEAGTRAWPTTCSEVELLLPPLTWQ